MNRSAAIAFINLRLQPDADPALPTGHVNDLLELAATDDSDGHAPSDDDWTPTYSRVGCYRAIVEGWTMKHGLAVTRFSFATDGQSFQRGQILDHIEAQRALWARKISSSPSTLGRR